MIYFLELKMNSNKMKGENRMHVKTKATPHAKAMYHFTIVSIFIDFEG